MDIDIQAVNYATGAATGPYTVAIEDLNKDGYLDIVTSNYEDNSVSVLLGNSAGTFSPSPNSPYSVAKGPLTVKIADLNKDGYLDLVTANRDDNSVSVLLGNSAGAFLPSPKSPYSVGSKPFSVTISDLNGDGNLDIVTNNYGSNSVSILFGTTNGPFSQSIDGLLDQKIDPYKDESINASGGWSLPSLQPAIQAAFFTVGLSMLYLLKQQVDALTASSRQLIQQLNARLDAGAELEKKASPDSELPPYTAPVTQDLPGAIAESSE
jgi:hypothetical protein